MEIAKGIERETETVTHTIFGDTSNFGKLITFMDEQMVFRCLVLKAFGM